MQLGWSTTKTNENRKLNALLLFLYKKKQQKTTTTKKDKLFAVYVRECPSFVWGVQHILSWQVLCLVWRNDAHSTEVRLCICFSSNKQGWGQWKWFSFYPSLFALIWLFFVSFVSNSPCHLTDPFGLFLAFIILWKFVAFSLFWLCTLHFALLLSVSLICFPLSPPRSSLLCSFLSDARNDSCSSSPHSCSVILSPISQSQSSLVFPLQHDNHTHVHPVSKKSLFGLLRRQRKCKKTKTTKKNKKNTTNHRVLLLCLRSPTSLDSHPSSLPLLLPPFPKGVFFFPFLSHFFFQRVKQTKEERGEWN